MLLAHEAIAARASRTLRKTPGRVPSQAPPTLIERAYARAIIARVVPAMRKAFAPLLASMPGILARGREAARLDSPGKDAGDAARAGADALAGSIDLSDLEALAAEFANKVSQHQRIQMNRQTKSAVGVEATPADRTYKARVEAFTYENAALIVDITQDAAARMQKLVTRAVTDGMLHPDLAREVEKIFAYSEKRSRLIARDQVGKFYGATNALRLQEIGVKRFTWRTVDDQRVRGKPGGRYPKAVPSHHARNGVVYDFANPPKGELPGIPILCRCTAEPVFDEIGGVSQGAPKRKRARSKPKK